MPGHGGKTLGLGMVVRNQAASLERCLAAVAPFVDGWVIGDAGSTDGSQDLVRSLFAARGVSGELFELPFTRVEQAWNEALDRAHGSPMAFDYLLLIDAELELVVEDPDFRTRLEGLSYELLQRGEVSNWMTRIVRRDAGVRYRGVACARLEVPAGAGRLGGLWLRDHGGGDRSATAPQDIRLLRQALEQEPENARYWSCLAASLLAAGQVAEAAEAFARRASMGGPDEEAWQARLQYARSLLRLGDEAAFVREALGAFAQRPHRAEPLYDLARFHLDQGRHESSARFAEWGLRLAPPRGDSLGIEDFVYEAGLLEQLAIAANYARDPERWSRGFDACEWLALGRGAPRRQRGLARHNLRFYVRSAERTFASFRAAVTGETQPGGAERPPDWRLEAGGSWAADSLTPIANTIPFDGGALGLVREAWAGATEDDPVAWLRFAWLDAGGALRAVSRPFYLSSLANEQPTGLVAAPAGDALQIEFVGPDRAPAGATIDASEVRSALSTLAEYDRRARTAAAGASLGPRVPRIWLFIPYFGSLPNYFQLYLDSLRRNADCLSVFFLTDVDLLKFKLPENLIVIPTTLDEFRERAAAFVSKEFSIDVEVSAILKQPYKLCDFKILFPEMLSGIGDRYGLRELDFVGWGDCDLIYGRLRDFIDMSGGFEIIGGFHGHFTAIRNIESFRRLFRNVPDLVVQLLDDTSRAVDEIAFREPLLDFLAKNKFEMFYMNRYFCDIVPDCFVSRFRQDHLIRRRNFFDVYNNEKDINCVRYSADGGLLVSYEDGTSRPAIYCHLQKRPMELDFEEYPNGYEIRETAFVAL